MNPFEDSDKKYVVVENDEGQQSLWPNEITTPNGWREIFGAADRDACLAHVVAGWTDLRPRTLLEGGTSGRLLPADMFEAQARRTPDAEAVVYEDEVLSYVELNARANLVAQRLSASGIGAEDVVAVLLPRSTLLVVAMLGILKAGAAYLPVETGYPAARIDYILRDAGPAAVLTPDHPALAPADLDDSRTDNPSRAHLRSEHAAYVVYTSGSTGNPKGIVMPLSGITNVLTWHCRDLPVRPGKRTAQFTAIGFDFSVQEMLSALVSGQTLVIPPDDVRTDMDAMVAWCDHHRVGELFAPTAVVDALLTAATGQGSALPALEDVYQGGEALHLHGCIRPFAQHTDVIRRLRVHNIYGPAETNATTTLSLVGDPADWPDTAPIGSTPPGVVCLVLDDDLRPADTGELYIAGAQVARGYLNRPDLTAQRFVAAPHGPPGSRMYRSGDLVRRVTEDSLTFLGRVDDQVKIRGFRVEPGEVEAAVLAHPGVAQVAVVAQPGPGGLRLVAYTVGSAAPAVLREHAESVLPEHQVPAVFVPVAELPLTVNGKVDRAALPAPDLTAAAVQGATPLERRLCALFAEVLEVPAFGPDDAFFESGGHSLLAARLTARIKTELGQRVSVRAVYLAPTPAELADHLESAAR